MLSNKSLLVIMLIVASTWVGCASAPNIDPQADQVLKRMSETLGGAEAFSFAAEGVMGEVLETGQLVQISRKSNILAVRPDKLHVDTEGDDVSRSAWYDGRTMTVLDKRAKTYASIEVPNTIEKMLDFVVEKYGLTIPVADLLFPKPYETLIANVLSGTYVGLHTTGGHACHHLAFQQEDIDWQIWIDAGKTSVPRKLVIIYKQEPGHPQYVGKMDKWDLSAKGPSGTFKFQPPAGTKRVEMADLFGKREGGQP